MLMPWSDVDEKSCLVSTDHNGDSRDSFLYNSEEEEVQQNEESLFYSLYFESNGAASLSNQQGEFYCVDFVEPANTLDVSQTCDSSSKKAMKRKRNEEESNTTKNLTKEIKKNSRTKVDAETEEAILLDDESLNSKEEIGKEILVENSPFVSCISSSEKDIKKGQNFCEVITLQSDSDCSLESDVIIDDDSKLVHKGEKKADKNDILCIKRSKKSVNEVIELSGTSKSSDSSSSFDSTDDDEDDDDIDVHLIRSSSILHDDKIVQSIVKNLPECDWKINDLDRTGPLPTMRSRYYNPFSKVKCNNCNERGHLFSTCPRPKKLKACILCGNRGHMSRSCSRSLCFRCNKPGHAAKNCERKRVWREDKCHRCGMLSHFQSNCPDMWRQYHLTTFAVTNDILRGRRTENNRKFCYNCAAKGHFGHECPRERIDRFTQPVNPFISKYDKNQLNVSKNRIKTNADAREKKEEWKRNDRNQEITPKKKKTDEDDMKIKFNSEIIRKKKISNKDSRETKKNKEINKNLTNKNLTNFAMKIQNALFRKRQNISGTESEKVKKKKKEGHEYNYIPLSLEQNERNSCEDNASRKMQTSEVGGNNKSGSSRSRLEKFDVFDFPRTPVDGKEKKNSFLDSSKLFKPDYGGGVRNGKWDWPQTSTPLDHLNIQRKFNKKEKKFKAINNPQNLNETELLAEYYGKSQIRSAKRKEKRRRKATAEDNVNKSRKSYEMEEEKCATRKVCQSKRGFQITIN